MGTVARHEIWNRVSNVFAVDLAVRTVFHFLRHTKVGDLDAALVVDEHVRAFDVAVYDVVLVQVIEAEQNLADPVAHEGLLERTVVPQKGGHRATRDVLQEDIQVVIVDAGC